MVQARDVDRALILLVDDSIRDAVESSFEFRRDLYDPMLMTLLQGKPCVAVPDIHEEDELHTTHQRRHAEIEGSHSVKDEDRA